MIQARTLAIPAVLGIALLGAFLWPAANMADESAVAANPAEFTVEDVRAIAELPLVAARLRDRLAIAPNDPEGWALLARTYVRLGEHQEAGGAFQKAVALQPNDATLLANYADTLAFLNNRSLKGEPEQLIERALQIDQNNASALLLAGLSAFDRHDYDVAEKRWTRLVDAVGTESPLGRQASQAIAEARKQKAAMR